MPLSKFIVQIYGVILEVGLWLTLLTAFVGGWRANGLIGALGLTLITAVLAAVFAGAFLDLNEIRDRVKAIETAQASRN